MASNKRSTAVTRREEQIENDAHQHQHQPRVSNALKIKLDHLKTLSPLTENQAIFFDMYKRGDYCIGLLGSAGTGKTCIALYKAIEEVLQKDNPFKQVVIVRSCVPTRSVGFLPGTLADKEEVYQLPYKEICQMLFGRGDAWERLIEQGYIRFMSTTAIRGISIDDQIIIVDEQQNLQFQEMDTVMSRVQYRSKIIWVGDFKQTDLLTNKNDVSGMPNFLRILRSMKDYTEIEFSRDDIVRQSLVKNYIIAKEELGF